MSIKSKFVALTRIGILISVGAISACGGGGSDVGDNNRSSSIARLEVQNKGLLLTTSGQKSVLSVKGYDTAGAEVILAPGSVSWRSDAPDAISVDSNGEIVALVQNGSAQITATNATITSQRMLATVAEKTSQTRIWEDAWLASTPMTVTAGAQLEVGVKFGVTLAPSAPQVSVNDILVATGQNPFIGRVIGVGATGKEILLEVVSPFVAFPGLVLSTRTDLKASDIVLADGIADNFQITTVDNDLTFELKTDKVFTFNSIPTITSTNDRPHRLNVNLLPAPSCKLATGAKLELAALKFKPSFKNIKLTATLAAGKFSAVAEGPYSVDLLAVPTITIPAGADAECDIYFGYLPSKVVGPFAWLLGTEVPVGAKFKLSAQLGDVVGKLEVGYSVAGALKVGVECSAGTCLFPHNFTGTTTNSVFKLGGDKALFKLGYKSGAYGFLKVRASPSVPWIDGPKILLTTTRIGVEVESSTAPVIIQANNDDAVAKFKVKLTARISSTDELEKFDNDKIQLFFKKFFEVNLTGYEFNLDILQKDSPTGTVSVSQRPLKVGDPFTISVSLDPTSTDVFGFGYILDSILLYTRTKDGTFSDLAFRSIPMTSGSNASVEIIATTAMLNGQIYAFYLPKYKFFFGSPALIGFVDLAVNVKPVVTAGKCSINQTPTGNVIFVSMSFAGSGTVTGDVDGQFNVFATSSGPNIDPLVGFSAGPVIKSLVCGSWTSTVDNFGQQVCRRDLGQPATTAWSFSGGPNSPVGQLFYYPVVGTSIKNPGFPVSCS